MGRETKSSAPLLLAPLTIVARRRMDAGREQFARGCKEGSGICLDLVAIALREPVVATDLLRGIPTVVLDPATGGFRRLAGAGCLLIFLNHDIEPIISFNPGGPASRIGAQYAAGSALASPTRRANTPLPRTGLLNRLGSEVAAGTIRGLEVYLSPRDVPDEIMFGPRKWALWPASTTGYLARCGAIVVWTADQR
ncbi:MAG: hypothetical protein WEG36_15770 [Gemmatimonadota bacterium]